MAFDFKKEYKEFYLPAAKPGIVSVPTMNYIAVRGSGNPNDKDGEYQAAMELLYGVWISVIRLPDFVTKADFDWAVAEAAAKKKKDFSKVEFLNYEEGLCVQCMHIGPYDDEPATIKSMREYVEEKGYRISLDDVRRHHEIYLSDPRRTTPEKLKTVIRIRILKNAGT